MATAVGITLTVVLKFANFTANELFTVGMHCELIALALIDKNWPFTSSVTISESDRNDSYNAHYK